MDKFFAERRGRHQKRMMKYMRYVFNDHFMLVCLFLVGGLGFYYSNLLKQLPTDFFWSLPIVAVVWWLVLPFGGLATLIEPADMTFLLPKEKQMDHYLSAALRHSLPLPFLIEGLICGALLPLVVLKGGSFSQFPFYLGLLWALKLAQLLVERLNSFQETQKNVSYLRLSWYFLSLVIILVSLYLNVYLGLLLSLLLLALFFSQTRAQGRLLDWSKLVTLENLRLHRIYQFINLFTDVPEIESKVKRRKYLDALINRISFKQDNTYLYLFTRRALRGSEFSGLFIRLVLVGGIILYSLTDLWFSVGVAVLFIYLIGFQLIPLYSQFDYVSGVQLYPVAKKTKLEALQKLIACLLLVAGLIYFCFACFQLGVLNSLVVLAIILLEIALFSLWYLPSRIKKMEA